MHGTRRTIVAGVILLTAGIAGSLALANEDDHGSAPAAPHGATKAPATPPASHDDDHAPAPSKKPASKANQGAHEDSATTAKQDSKDEHATSKAVKADAKKVDAKPELKPSPSLASEETPTTPEAALEALKAGNERWVAGKTTSPNTSSDRRASVAANGQKPFATIYTCADSRLPVERMFDRGVGDVFVLRIAGNVVGEHAAGTIEYGVEHLHTPLLVIMGHTKCGAVNAACAGGHAGGHIDSLLSEIKPAVDRAKASNPEATDEKLVEKAITENVWQSVFQLLRTSETVRRLVAEGKVKVVGAVCDISTGKVQFLGEHPWQGQLMQAFDAAAIKENHAEAR